MKKLPTFLTEKRQTDLKQLVGHIREHVKNVGMIILYGSYANNKYVYYDPAADMSMEFFKTVQNKLHWAVTGRTAAELIFQRCDSSKPNMGLTPWLGAKVRKQDVGIAKKSTRLYLYLKAELFVFLYVVA